MKLSKRTDLLAILVLVVAGEHVADLRDRGRIELRMPTSDAICIAAREQPLATEVTPGAVRLSNRGALVITYRLVWISVTTETPPSWPDELATLKAQVDSSFSSILATALEVGT